MITDTAIKFDIQKLKEVLDYSLKFFDVHKSEPNQVCVTCRTNVLDKDEQLYEGVGRLKDGLFEENYNNIADYFKNTYFEEILSGLPFKIGRTRIMRMPPRHCMSIHYDSGIRYHIALKTNRMAYILFKDNPSSELYQKDFGIMYHIPEDGKLYRMDASKIHTAFNGGMEYRYHLVICGDD